MWWPLEEAIEHFGGKFLIDRRIKVHDESSGWGAVEPNDEGILSYLNGPEAVVDFDSQAGWVGELWCFDVWVGKGEKPDEVDIL